MGKNNKVRQLGKLALALATAFGASQAGAEEAVLDTVTVTANKPEAAPGQPDASTPRTLVARL